MEIKSGQIGLTISEARWIARQIGLPPELRRTVEQGRRSVLLPPGLFDGVVEIASDINGDPNAARAYIELQAVLQAIEMEGSNRSGNGQQHLIEVEATDAELGDLHAYAVRKAATAREKATNFSRFTESLDAADQFPEDKLTNSDTTSFEEERFREQLEDLQVTAGIIAAIEQAGHEA